MVNALFDFLKRIGIPTCVALVFIACVGGVAWANTRFALKNDLVEARVTLRADFNIIRETQLAQSVREVHIIWCREADEKIKNYWWAELQRYQSSYQLISTNGEIYKTPPCPASS